MAIQLVTDQLSDDLDDKFRDRMIGNFKTIEKALNDLDTAQGKIEGEFANINDENIATIVKILSKYDVPIQIVNGKVVDTKEGE